MASFKLTKADIDEFYSRLPSCTIEKVEYRGITINQLQFVYDEIEARCTVEGWKDELTMKLLTPAEVNLYHIKEKIIKLRTTPLQCSYVELIALGEQIAEWFVSHWWGEPVFAFIKCLKRHAKDRGLSWDTPYWICAYANNQHPGKIEEEMVGNPFLKAMEISKGTVSILDKDCVVYSRIWCIYELYKSLMDKKDDHKFDVYTEHDWEYYYKGADTGVVYPDFKDSGDAIGLTDGFIESDNYYGSPNPVFKKLREHYFPLERIMKAGAIDIKKAVASEARDEKYIKNTITNQNEDDNPPEHHDNYEKLNNLIRGFFVSSSLDRILKDESIESDQKSIYFNILKQSSATVIYLNMGDYTPFDDSIATELAVCLPSTITSFTFASDGSSITQQGNRAIIRGLANLTNLELLFLYHNSIDDETCLVLADAIRNNNNVWELDLRDNKIGDEGAKAISDALKINHTLEILSLDQNQISVDGAIAIAVTMRINITLKILSLFNNKVGDKGVKALADALSTNQCLEGLNLGGNRISDKGAIAIAVTIRVNHTLKTLYLHANQITDVGVIAIAAAFGTNTTIITLDLAINKVGVEGAKALADALSTNHCLEELQLSFNGISDVGAIAIATVLRINNTLKKLNLSINEVGDEGVKALANALSTNHCLEELGLGGNGISDEESIAIAAALLVNNTMKKLDLAGNHITDVGATYIAAALKINCSLKHLNLEYNERMSEQTMQYIASTMRADITFVHPLSDCRKFSFYDQNVNNYIRW